MGKCMLIWQTPKIFISFLFGSCSFSSSQFNKSLYIRLKYPKLYCKFWCHLFILKGQDACPTQIYLWEGKDEKEDSYSIPTWPLYLVSLWTSNSFTRFNHKYSTLPGLRSFSGTWAQPMSSGAWIPSSSKTLTVKCCVDASSTMNSKCSFQTGFNWLFWK